MLETPFIAVAHADRNRQVMNNRLQVRSVAEKASECVGSLNMNGQVDARMAQMRARK